MQRIGVIGAGAWGTALAQTAVRAGRDVVLWARDAAVVDQINRDHLNREYLPGCPLDPALVATPDLAAACEADAVLLVVPAQFLRAVCRDLAPLWRPGSPAVLCSKGIELSSGALMTDVVRAELPAGTPLACLSGPSFAAEVAKGLPTAVTIASDVDGVAEQLVQALGTRTFRPYHSADLIGAETGGAVKNVLAIACGILEGAGLGDNARAALLTRGLAEITRLGIALGGQPQTFMGLSGMGDLMLTATSMQSRNFSLGFALGQGRALAEILAERKAVTEGVATAAAVTALARQRGIDMPLCAAVDALLNHGQALPEVIDGLLTRPFRQEQG
ncbi:NAD(P)H-dependent glycerol-3-phosphate dehydrogenase [Novispirillum itersonii subsp. nipponicum]|uniref:Glycerol-3-phosphate dehydrogenase [NAD(P)+] n=1 Tax=Novispirillum itersonii TaxID=189 RepID=A0A7W9ZE26_NOVIT|nr:glycerol-3-phosphate dehydrogenase (NAD(P)+) [Novispirillum itersonii]